MELDETLADDQSQPAAGFTPGPFLVKKTISREEIIDALRRDAHPCIFHGYGNDRVLLCCQHLDGAVFGELDGVINQVVHDLKDFHTVDNDCLGRKGVMKFDSDVFIDGEQYEVVKAQIDELGDIGRFLVKLNDARLDFGDVQQFVYKGIEVL